MASSLQRPQLQWILSTHGQNIRSRCPCRMKSGREASARDTGRQGCPGGYGYSSPDQTMPRRWQWPEEERSRATGPGQALCTWLTSAPGPSSPRWWSQCHARRLSSLLCRPASPPGGPNFPWTREPHLPEGVSHSGFGERWDLFQDSRKRLGAWARQLLRSEPRSPPV